MKKLKEISEEQIKGIKSDWKKGKSERDIANAWGVSRSVIRRLLGLPNNLRSKRQVRNSMNMFLANMEVKISSDLVVNNEIKIFEIIKSSILEMEEISNHEKVFLQQVLSELKVLSYEIKNRNSEYTNEELGQLLQDCIHKLDGIYLRTKLRIESRKELGNWLDRYIKYFDVSEREKSCLLMIDALVSAINSSSDDEYKKITKIAREICPDASHFFPVMDEVVKA